MSPAVQVDSLSTELFLSSYIIGEIVYYYLKVESDSLQKIKPFATYFETVNHKDTDYKLKKEKKYDINDSNYT